MDCKVDKIRIAWAAGDQIGALRIAARFFDRAGWMRTTIPASTSSLGNHLIQLTASALQLLAKKFKL
jgi:hypothetical protein